MKFKHIYSQYNNLCRVNTSSKKDGIQMRKDKFKKNRKKWQYIKWFGHVFSKEKIAVSLLPHMPILGSSNSAANKNMMSKYMDKWGTLI